ncbi:glycoside hydrolase family 3 C-terminal domain-containing protein [Aureibaculum sp. A20]|uniref:Glycoside hydrolase family 3 C-terminal domain-containing protein n=1 Tax=Aureibaculum flavum TaxID=2795986 RepID=A0ABS0WQS2_9FLAO|nr:beta-glucosidase [Aureibaculum flavum]MBJ2174213.1 glycoside hydrolase family 3 C-terminal domain-containing protein [Aureibaculum flavum]
MKKLHFCWFIVLQFYVNVSFGQQVKFPFEDASLSIDFRVNDLVSRMTLEEKVSQMMNESPEIKRLHIPEYEWWNECLHGVARAGKATVFPQAIGLAATWDTNLIYRSAMSISDEARAKYNEAQRNNEFKRYQGLTFWTPNVNIFRDPRWGRGQETYGEDPYLTGRMGVNFVKGLQGDNPDYLKLVATPKHFAVHNGPEPERHFFDALTNERDFYDTYLPAFEVCIKEGKAYSIMGAYNRYMGEPCCASHRLLNDILRKDWGFEGYVVSDCGAIRDIHDYHNFVDSKEEAAAVAVKAGCDLNCGDRYTYLTNAVAKGDITEDEIDISLKRLFKARFKLGMFDAPEKVPYSKISMDVVSSPKHRALALETAQKSMVLLKNEDNTLPLKKNIKSIAVVGPNANHLEVLLGNYNGFPENYITPLEGIKNKVSKDTKVYFETGCNLIDSEKAFSLIPTEFLSYQGKSGLQATYYNSGDLSGASLPTRIEKVINSNWNSNPLELLEKDGEFSVNLTGTLKVEVSGEYTLSLLAKKGYKLSINNEVLIDNWKEPKSKRLTTKVFLKKGKKYAIDIDCAQIGYPSKMKLEWITPEKTSYDKAIEIAKKSEVVIFVGGISANVEGEQMRVTYDGFDGGDKTNIKLPAIQKQLIKDLHATGKPVILVLLNGSALAVNWEEENLPAILEAWYPGELGGTAISDVLFGDYNPSGRLPVTFYKSIKDLPPFVNYAMKGRTYRYFEGETLYPFGYGLSYTSFDYNNIKLTNQKIKANESTSVSIDVTNIGKFQGDEVVQLYIKDLESKEVRPLKSLRGIKRISLDPQETIQVNFTIKPEDLSFHDFEQNKQVVEPGLFQIGIGKSSDDFININLEVTN